VISSGVTVGSPARHAVHFVCASCCFSISERHLSKIGLWVIF
jgi:hypothetical protein